MSRKHDFAVVIPAAGSGKRFGKGDKLMVELDGQTVLQRSVGAFARRADVAQIIMVTGADRFAAYRKHLHGVVEGERLEFVEGGRERWESVLFGLRAVREGIEYVGIHDAARPLVSQAVIDAAFHGAVEVGGSVPVVPEPATLKRLGTDRQVTATVIRAGLYQAQTPQCFAIRKLRAANEELLRKGELESVTDDAQIFEGCGLSVLGTVGSVLNMKITTAEDVALARAILLAQRSGNAD